MSSGNFESSSHPPEERGRAPSLQQANLQASYRMQMHRPTLKNTDRFNTEISHSSLANSFVGEMGHSFAHRMSKRNSVSSTVDHYAHNVYQPPAKLENTFRLGPSEVQKFNSSRVRKLVGDILNNHLQNAKYEPNKSKDLVQILSEEIKMRVKSIIYKRYKLVVNITIGQNNGNSIILASRALWNPETDNECTVEFKNNSLYCIASVYAAYFD